jgi:hypothetical protein
MESAERQVVMTIMESNSYAWSAECIQQIMTKCLITIGQMTDLRTWIIVARQHPESLDYDLATLQAGKAADEAAVGDTEAQELKIHELLHCQ